MLRYLPLLTLVWAAAGSTQAADVHVPIATTFDRYLDPFFLRQNEGRFAPGQWQEIQAHWDHLDRTLRVASYNLLTPRADRYNAPMHAWKNRLPRIAQWIQATKPHVLATQELSAAEVALLLRELGEGYGAHSVAEKTGGRPAETSGILYDRKRLKLLAAKTQVLSATPDDLQSKDPDGAQRFLTRARFEVVGETRTFTVFNTHLHFASSASREYGARRMMGLIAAYRKAHPGEAIIATGDFNTYPPLHGSGANPVVFWDGHYIERILGASGLEDARRRALIGVLGSLSSFTDRDNDDFSFTGDGTPGVRLDHILVSDEVTVLLHAIDPYRAAGRFYPSDHKPVIAEVVL